MKRRIAILLLLLLSAVAATVAQDVKRVAILETVDRDGNVPTGVKNLLRQSITFGINRIDGYEGYNRVNMDQINKEYEFQRTGYVSDADIKKLGEMTGYVLIAEASIYDAENIVVFANLIDVETGRVANSSIPKVAGINPKSMYEDCAEVAKSLLGVAQSTTKVAEKTKSATPTGYTDLGLPSGTKWKNFNATGFFTYDEAVSQFGNRLPTKEQWNELKAECQWQWTGSGYKVTGPNGNSIDLPAAGCRSNGGTYNVGSLGGYWSSTSSDSSNAWYLGFGSGGVDMYSGRRSDGISVRLVQD